MELAGMEKELQCLSLALWVTSARESCKISGGNNTKTPGSGIWELGYAWKGWAHAGIQPVGEGIGTSRGHRHKVTSFNTQMTPLQLPARIQPSLNFPRGKGHISRSHLGENE